MVIILNTSCTSSSYTRDMGIYVVEHEYYNSVDCAGQPA